MDFFDSLLQIYIMSPVLIQIQLAIMVQAMEYVSGIIPVGIGWELIVLIMAIIQQH